MLCPVQFHPVFAARIFLDSALPVLVAPHSIPALIFCLNSKESHVSIRQIIVRRASTRRAPAIASWPRARLRLTLTREKEEQKPDSATGGCQQKHCSHGKDQHAGSSNEPLEYRGMLDARAVSTFCSPPFARYQMMRYLGWEIRGGIVGRGTKQRPTSSCRSPVGNSVGPCGLTLDW